MSQRLHRHELRRALTQLGTESRGERRSAPRTAAEWMRDPGIVGLGIARRRTNGKTLEHLALKVYVARKLPKSRCKRVVPKRIDVGDGRHAIVAETDVEEIGELRLHANTGLARPLVVGFGISPAVGGAGTIGCFVRQRTAPTGVCVLSAGHTFLAGRTGQIGDALFQPAREDDPAGPPRRVAQVVDEAPLQFSSSGFPNFCDVAIGRLDIGISWDPTLVPGGAPSTVASNLRTGMTVRINGRTSGEDEGLIVDIDFAAAFDFAVVGGGRRRAGFRAQVLCTGYGAPGDSGAAVVSSGGSLLGFHLAGSDSHSVFSRAPLALRAVDCELIAMR